MSLSYLPAAAAEFPNDNSDLHRGARWVCLTTRGPARALLKSAAPDAARATPAPQAQPPTSTSPAPRVAVEAAPAAQRFKGPLELDLNRIILIHRVEDVPPPPDFIFRPFVSSRLSGPRMEGPAEASPAPIQPVPCRVVDGRDAGRRVDRGWRVDIAPCLSVGAVAPLPAVVAEVSRRSTRRRGRLAARALSSLPNVDDVSRAISELEAAFAQAALHSSPDEGAGVAACRASRV